MATSTDKRTVGYHIPARPERGRWRAAESAERPGARTDAPTRGGARGRGGRGRDLALADGRGGKPGKNLINNNLYSKLIHPPDRVWTDNEIRAALATHEPFIMIYRLSLGSGQKWVWDQGRGVYDERGNAVAFEGFVTDVTERKQAEDDLRWSEERYRASFNDAPIGRYRTTPDGRVLLVNPALARMLGYDSPEELTRRNLGQKDFEPGYARTEFMRLMGEKGEVRGLETAWRRRDGSTVYIRENAKAVHGPDGEFLHFDGTVEDLSERRAAEEKLLESEERYRRLVDLSPDGLAVHQDGIVVMVNPAGARILGYARAEEVVGKPVMVIVHPDDRQRVTERISSALEEGRIGELVEERFRQSDGAYIWVEVINAPFFWQGRPAVQVWVRDVSERRWLQSKLEESAAQMRAIFESSPHGIAAELAGRIEYANRAFARIYGYEVPGVLYGMPVTSLVAEADRDRLALYALRRERGEDAPRCYVFTGLRRDGSMVRLRCVVSTYVVEGRLYILGTVEMSDER